MRKQRRNKHSTDADSKNKRAPVIGRTSLIVEVILALIYVQNCFSGHWHGWWPKTIILLFVVIGAKTFHEYLCRHRFKNSLAVSIAAAIGAMTIAVILLWVFPDPPERIETVALDVTAVKSQVASINSDVTRLKSNVGEIQSSMIGRRLSDSRKRLIVEFMKAFKGTKHNFCIEILSPADTESIRYGGDFTEAMKEAGWNCFIQTDQHRAASVDGVAIVCNSESNSPPEDAILLAAILKAMGLVHSQTPLKNDVIVYLKEKESPADELRLRIGPKSMDTGPWPTLSDVIASPSTQPTTASTTKP